MRVKIVAYFLLFTLVLRGQPSIDYSEILVKVKSEQNIKDFQELMSHKSLNATYLFQKNAINRYSETKIWNILSVKLPNPDDGRFFKYLQEFDFIEWVEYRDCQELFYEPNDPLIGSQYYLDLIRAFDAWNISLGDSTVKVGIVDTGIDPTHIELVNQIAYNYLDPVNGIDDDGDGFIDNFMGWNIAENNYNVTADVNLHGVGVAGIVVAQSNNGIGIAGVAPGVRILPVKIMSYSGLLKSSYEGVVYAAEHGCKIIVCSWGGVLPSNLGREVIRYVVDELGVLVVAAAGNSRNEDLYYPASYPGVVSVLASNQFNHKWEGSTYGYRIDITAPGQNILSTAFGNTYSSSSGTSNAAPIVAGVASVIKSLRPHLNPYQIAAQIKATAMCLDTMPANVPYRDKMGAGRVDMFRAVSDTNLFYLHIPTKIIDAEEVCPSETYRLKGELKNLLCSKNGVTVTISPLSEYVSIANNTFTVNNWQSGDIVQLEDYNIRLIIDANTPLDLLIPVRFTYSVDGRNYREVRTISTEKSWYDIDMFDLKMTLSNVGKPAYHSLSPLIGNGFRKENSSPLLWDVGLVVGKSEVKVVSGIYNNADFISNRSVSHVENMTLQQATAYFTDINSPNSVGLDYQVTAYTGSEYPLNTAVIYEVTVTNVTNATIENIRVGMFANWIVRTGAIVTTNRQLQLVTTNSADIYPYTHGVTVLSDTESFNNYTFDTGASPQGVDITDNFTTQEMWQALNNSREMTYALEKTTPAHLTSAKIDVLQPAQPQLIRFAFLTDSHVSQIERHVQALRNHFTNISETDKPSFIVYPNPANKTVLFSETPNKVTVYNLLGEKVFETQTAVSELNVENWASGVYLFVVEAGGSKTIHSIVVGSN
ncbi:MAG TPA: S8 family serine peptidase [Salinivirgaceae bacterium]|nr:S8 family serine peptidase [Salinivirgaceae bacterium]